MSQVMPPLFTAAQLREARAAFARVVGEEWVFVDAPKVATCASASSDSVQLASMKKVPRSVSHSYA
jgi:hypothetical protein